MITYIRNMPPIRSEEFWARNRSLKVGRMIALLKTALEVPKREGTQRDTYRDLFLGYFFCL